MNRIRDGPYKYPYRIEKSGLNAFQGRRSFFIQGGVEVKNKPIQVLFTAAGSILSSLLGVLYVPVLLMVGCNVIDYVTGLMAAPSREDGISSYRSMKGITKKITMWLLVVVGAIIDRLLAYTSETLGFQMPFKFLIACIVVIWIICNELISILENMIDIGVNIPGFLMPLVKNIKKQTENLTGSIEEQEKRKDQPGG